jgi:hypothetical protein
VKKQRAVERDGLFFSPRLHCKEADKCGSQSLVSIDPDFEKIPEQ